MPALCALRLSVATFVKAAAFCCFVSLASLASAQQAIRFDLAPLSVVEPCAPSESALPLPGQRLVRIPLRISALVDSPRPPRIDQVMVQIFSTDPSASVVDYAPRTALASPYEGNLEVSKTEERSKHLGFALNGDYGHMVEGNIVGDSGKKDIECVKFHRVAPLEVVAASGTLGRGRGVYFKLRATALQVLEGDKQFEVVLSVPDDWQSGLLDVRISADASRRVLGGLDTETQCLGRAQFVVAAFIDEVPAVRRAAMELVEAETLLRQAAVEFAAQRPRRSPSLFRHVATALEIGQPEIRVDWLYQVMRGTVDPHLDRDIRSLPVDVRVAILDYREAQQAFVQAGHVEANQIASN